LLASTFVVLNHIRNYNRSYGIRFYPEKVACGIVDGILKEYRVNSKEKMGNYNIALQVIGINTETENSYKPFMICNYFKDVQITLFFHSNLQIVQMKIKS
jgi:hypothetical protein